MGSKRQRCTYQRAKDYLLSAHGSTLLSSFGDVANMERLMIPSAVGNKFIVVFEYYGGAQEDEERWTARIATLRGISANVNTNHMECSFMYDEANPIHCNEHDEDEDPQLSRTIVVPNTAYALYSCENSDERVRVEIPDNFRELLEAHGHRQVAYFGNPADVTQLVSQEHQESPFLVVYSQYAGWSAYVATLKHIERCLPHVPLCVFEYSNDGEGPLFSTEESQLPHNQLPRLRVGVDLNYYLFTV